ncbi:MAG: glycosyltransferase family 4 protein [Crocosphaera sp.]
MMLDKVCPKNLESSNETTHKSPKRAIMTICSNNYFPYARTLLSSLKRYHPEASLFLCLADISNPDIELGIESVTIVEGRQLGIPHFEDFAFRYDIMELNTALKPFMMAYLVEQLGFEQVVYLDPDIELFAPLDPIFNALNNGSNFVLTPHITTPAETPEETIEYFPSDIGIMKAGIYNLGFIAVSNHGDAIQFLHWWGRRLRFQCLNQQHNGIFVDQKFVDLLPGFHDNVKVLRNPTLNVAYWNLWQRELEETPDGWLVNGQPLIFFHFSGIIKNNPHRLSKYTGRFNGNLEPALQSLVEHYISQLKLFESKAPAYHNYFYGQFDNGTPITNFIRALYQNVKDAWIENPFAEFHHYLNQPAWQVASSSPYPLTNLMYSFWKHREDFQKTFNLEIVEHCKQYALWFIQNSEELQIDPFFLYPIFEQLNRINCHHSQTCIKSSAATDKPDVSVIGYLQSVIGLGHAGRMVAASLETTSLETKGFNVTLNVEARQGDNSVNHLLSPVANGRIHIYNINADQLPLVKDAIRDHVQPADYVISMPFWELSKFPTEWLSNYEGINEIWAPTRFIQQALVPVMNIPVFWMPPAVKLENFTRVDREHFDLPNNRFLFHFNFDLSSFATRKNPMAVIEAYRRAFRQRYCDIPTGLVIKTRGVDADGSNLQKLIDLTQDESDIFIVNQLMSYEDTLSLMDCCDCYVSLHRSEGFGYTLTEAMLLGKPVIATDYSGSKDFVDASTGFPVNYQLKPLNEGDYPFWQGQKWADPDIDHAAWLMQNILNDQYETKTIAEAGRNKILRDYSLQAIGGKYKKHLSQQGLL